MLAIEIIAVEGIWTLAIILYKLFKINMQKPVEKTTMTNYLSSG